MYLSRIRQRPDADPGQLAQQFNGTNAYREHQLVWRLFPNDPEAKRDFLFRADNHHGAQHYLLLSRRPPVADPLIWEVETKEYHPKLRQDQRLAFQLRANPVITRKNASGRSCRHDIVMDAKKALGWSELPASERPHLPDLIQTVGEAWLAKRLATHGATLETVRVDGYQPQNSHKEGAKGPIRHATLEFEGILKVQKPEPFTRLLYTGLGPAKAFGCGLLLVRKV